MIDSIEMNFAYTFAGVQLGKYHQTLCCHWVSCLLQFTFDQVVSGPKDVVEEGISKALSTNVSKRYCARIAVFFFRRSSRCSTCKSCKCAALCCPSLLQKFRLGTGDVAGVCLPALSRKEQALVFATGSTKLLLILVLVISGSCKLYTPSYIGKISQK